jgi:DNA gyrase subunit A
MGKYHPHGDQSVYDALVRMGQDFSLRHPLVDKPRQLRLAVGPAGRVPLHRVPARAAGHAHARRHRRGHRRLHGNFDGPPRSRPCCPSRFPNLLVNGSQGIAVGMATNIPPHNLGEVIDATLHLIDNPEATVDDLMEFVKGPDFPTGGQIMGAPASSTPTAPGAARSDARQGRDRGGPRGEQIVVTEIPYQTSVEQIEVKIAELVNAARSRASRHPQRVVGKTGPGW